MSIVSPLARPLLAGVFIAGGIDVLRRPEPRAELAAPVIEQMQAALPVLPEHPHSVVRTNAAVQIGAGALLALGIAPRLAALTLAGSLVPTTFGGHRFWEIEDPRQRAQQRTHFLKNAAILGGLLLAVFD
jgi:uncharacterized membrane protein YphA (DoxX/SURF4 family)